MSKKHIITLAGDPASGKGTVSKLLETIQYIEMVNILESLQKNIT